MQPCNHQTGVDCTYQSSSVDIPSDLAPSLLRQESTKDAENWGCEVGNFRQQISFQKFLESLKMVHCAHPNISHPSTYYQFYELQNGSIIIISVVNG